MQVRLREITKDDEHAFLEGAKAWTGEDPNWYSFFWREGIPYQDYLEVLRKEKSGIDLKPNRVPHSMLYGFVDGKIIGRVSIRHELNDQLRKRGGNIGYSVAPKFRKKGYATQMLGQALDYCRDELKLEKILITCADKNIPSWKLIEKYNGELQDIVWDEKESEDLRRYWVKL